MTKLITTKEVLLLILPFALGQLAIWGLYLFGAIPSTLGFLGISILFCIGITMGLVLFFAVTHLGYFHTYSGYVVNNKHFSLLCKGC